LSISQKTALRLSTWSRSGEYEAILLDLMMPGMDGLEVLESVQKAEDPPQTIVLTAYATIEKAVRATRLGAFDFITKPFKTTRSCWR